MNVRQALLTGASAIALNAAVASAMLIPQQAMAACLAVSSDTAINNSASDCVTWSGGNLEVGPSGTITGAATGISNAGNTVGTLLNIGTIAGSTTGINNTGTIGGADAFAIENTSTGSINTLTNSNLIVGTLVGIGNSGHIGTLSNTGTISGPGVGHEALYNDGTIDVLLNGGTLTGADGMYIKEGSIGSINNAGGAVITGITSVGILNQSTIGGITNAGTISGMSGGINNSASIGYIGNSGLITGASYGINNSGTIGGGATGIINNAGGTISGIVNSGLITGNPTGINNDGSIGSVTNSGTITGRTYGIFNSQGHIGLISNSETISATTEGGIWNDRGTIGTITNSGTISGFPGIFNQGTIGTITNQGSIASVDTAIVNYGGKSIGTLSNSGTISGVIGISNAGSIGSLINNRGGVITGGNSGLFINPGTIAAITNNGTISGGSVGIGLYSNGGGSIGTIGNITNNGLISAPSAINSFGPIQSAISNSGTIAGNINVNQALTITGGSSSAPGVLTGYNSGAGTITATGLTFDSHAYQLLDDDVNVGSGAGMVTNSGGLQVNAVHTITGNYTQGAGALLAIGVTGPGNYGRLVITGDANMADDHIKLNGSLASGEEFTIVKDAGTANYTGIAATAGSYEASVTSSIVGGDDDLLVKLGGIAYGPLGQSAGGGVAPVVGGALNQIFLNGNPSFTPVFTALNNLSPGAEQLALKQLGPSQLAPELMATGFLIGQNVQVISQHQQALLQQQDGGPAGQAAGSPYQSGIFWGQVSGGFANRDSTSEADGYHQNFGGLAVGVDDHISDDTTVGVGLGWMQGYATGFDSLAGSNLTTNSIQLTGYGTRQFGPAFVNGMAGVGYNIFDQSRYISFLNADADSRYDGMEYMARVDGGWNFPVHSYTLTPLAGVQAIRTDNDGYSESGAGMGDLSVGGLTANTVTTFLGGQATTKLSTSWGDVTPLAKVEWEHDLQQGPISSPALLGGVSFATATPRETPNGALVVLSATLQHSDNLSLKAEYDGDIRSDYSSHAGQIKVNWDF